jgi:hypothetical protein
MTRNGKIARLPAAIREELNQRLLEGEQGKPLVLWLNSLPRVQALLKNKFQGIPISEVSLSHWKNGGFPAWEAGEQMADSVSSIIQGTTALQAEVRLRRLGEPGIDLAACNADQPVKVNNSEFK